MRNGTSDLQIWHFVGCSTKGAHHSEESEGLKFNFPWGISFFFVWRRLKVTFCNGCGVEFRLDYIGYNRVSITVSKFYILVDNFFFLR